MIKFGDPLFLLTCQNLDDRRMVFLVSVQRVPVDRVEESRHRIKVPLRERVVLVIVAPRTIKSHPQENRPGRDDSVDDVSNVNFLSNRAAFAGCHMAAVEARRDELIFARVFQQIACQLLNGELVKRHVPIKRSHHPVTIRPHLAIIIQVQPVSVTVPRRVQPVLRHVLAVAL